jgi:hypothetical protein
MRLNTQPVQAVRFELPKAVWMPTPLRATIPDCYQGTPLEMVEQMAADMKPGLGVHDAIDTLLRALADERDVHIDLDAPAETPEATRATMFVYALLFMGVAEEMAQA